MIVITLRHRDFYYEYSYIIVVLLVLKLLLFIPFYDTPPCWYEACMSMYAAISVRDYIVLWRRRVDTTSFVHFHKKNLCWLGLLASIASRLQIVEWPANAARTFLFVELFTVIDSSDQRLCSRPRVDTTSYFHSILVLQVFDDHRMAGNIKNVGRSSWYR